MKKKILIPIIVLAIIAVCAGGLFTYLSKNNITFDNVLTVFTKDKAPQTPAEQVEYDIRNFGEVNIDSLEKLDDIKNRYEALSNEEKNEVKNIETLDNLYKQYPAAFINGFDSAVKQANAQGTAEDYDRLISFKETYENLSESEKAKIADTSLLNDALEKCAESKRKKIINELNTQIKNGGDISQSVYNTIVEYRKILTTQDIETYIVYAVRDDALKHAEERTKDYLKKSKSYKRKDYEIRNYAYVMPDKTYEISVNIDYTYENNAGKTAKNNRLVYCYYKVNSKGIQFKKAELSKNDIWRIVHRGA